jgi:hypothetical protein
MPDHASKVTFPRPRRDADLARYGRLRRHDPIRARRGVSQPRADLVLSSTITTLLLATKACVIGVKSRPLLPLIELGEEFLGTQHRALSFGRRPGGYHRSRSHGNTPKPRPLTQVHGQPRRANFMMRVAWRFRAGVSCSAPKTPRQTICRQRPAGPGGYGRSEGPVRVRPL